MEKENSITHVTDEDLSFVEKELNKSLKPLSLSELTEKLAYQKTASQRIQAVKKYDPYCRYAIGDSIYKGYDEPLNISSRGAEHFKGAVVLKVIGKTHYKSYNCEMLEVDYSGGGPFRKYIDYMKKIKTQVLLPSNMEEKAKAPEIMAEEEDPRLSAMPMTERDMKTLERHLKTALSKARQFFNWNDFWQLTANQVDIPEEKIKEMANFLRENGNSAFTEELVSRFFELEPSNDRFEIHCLSLNHILDKKFKKDFLYVSPESWGKWHLKEIVNSLKENLPLSAPQARLPQLEEEVKPHLSLCHAFPIKIYLTWREILSGGIKIPATLNKELSSAREYTFTDADEGHDHTVYYYPSSGFFLGLKEFFENNNFPQGTSLTLERRGETRFAFWMKKSKKKLAVAKLAYDSGQDMFSDTGEEVFTFALPNKIIFLERETITRLFSLYSQRNDLDLKELLLLVFKNFSLEIDNHSLHYLRAHHLVDILKQTTQEDVERVLLNSTEFSQSEKKKGLFHYHHIPEVKEKEAVEIPFELPQAAPSEELPEERPYPPSVEEGIREEIRHEAEPEPVPAEMAEPVKEDIPAPLPIKEKPPRKKRPKAEGERAPRAKKSERKVIEEKIEIEESEQEALSAIKEKEYEEEQAELRARDKKEDFKPVSTGAGQPAFGLFAEKLKSALTKKKEDQKKP